MKSRILLPIIISLCALSGCVVPDPLYSANAGRIPNAEQSPNRVVGIWATMALSPVQTNHDEREMKSYYQINSGGTGKIRQVVFNRVTNDRITLEAPLRWQYEGRNNWRVTIPPSDKVRVTQSNGPWSVGPSAGRETAVRYFEGNLYEPSTGRVWVPANADSVSRMANRLRSTPPAVRITIPQ